MLGHRRVEEAPLADLVRVADGRGVPTGERLCSAAAASFEAMSAAAREEGVTLLALSGYRSVADQQAIFFGIKSERGPPLLPHCCLMVMRGERGPH